MNLAESIGLSKEELQDYIKTEEPSKILEESSFELGRCGINGVPTFFIEDKIVIGAQPYEVFETTIHTILGE